MKNILIMNTFLMVLFALPTYASQSSLPETLNCTAKYVNDRRNNGNLQTGGEVYAHLPADSLEVSVPLQRLSQDSADSDLQASIVANDKYIKYSVSVAAITDDLVRVEEIRITDRTTNDTLSSTTNLTVERRRETKMNIGPWFRLYARLPDKVIKKIHADFANHDPDGNKLDLKWVAIFCEMTEKSN